MTGRAVRADECCFLQCSSAWAALLDNCDGGNGYHPRPSLSQVPAAFAGVAPERRVSSGPGSVLSQLPETSVPHPVAPQDSGAGLGLLRPHAGLGQQAGWLVRDASISVSPLPAQRPAAALAVAVPSQPPARAHIGLCFVARSGRTRTAVVSDGGATRTRGHGKFSRRGHAASRSTAASSAPRADLLFGALRPG